MDFSGSRRRRSRTLVRAFVAIGGLLVLALLAALIAPSFIDWTVYRSDFEREASRILGRRVMVEGEAAARLLPFPSVTFTDVVVEGERGMPLLSVDRFRMDAELAPYLSGEIRIFSMQLDQPALRVPIDEDGEVGFVLGSTQVSAGATVILEAVEIVDGRVIVDNAVSGRTHELSGIDASLSGGSLAGPYAGAGTLLADGQPVVFSASTGTPQEDGSLPLKVTTEVAEIASSFVFDGALAVKNGLPELNGTLRARHPVPPTPAGSEPAQKSEVDRGGVADHQANGAEVAGMAPSIAVSSEMVATPRSVQLDEIRVEAGGGDAPYVLTGKGSIDLRQLASFDFTLQGEQVNVDELGTEAAPEGVRKTFGDRLRGIGDVLAAIPRPSVPGTIQVALPVIVAGDTTIRDAAFTASPTDAGWSLARLTAELPGRTRLEASGIVTVDGEFAYSGDLLVASRQPSGLADWLSGDVDPAIRSLTAAGLSATVELSAAAQVFEELELNVGGNTLTGRLEHAESVGGGVLVSQMQGAALDIDALLALSRLFTEGAGALADPRLVELELSAGPVTYNEVSAGRVVADLRYDGTDLAIDVLDVDDLAGADITAIGRLTSLDGDAEGALDVSLSAAQPAAAIAVLRERLPGVPLLDILTERAGLMGPLVLSGEIATQEGETGRRPTLVLRLDGTSAGSEIGLSAAVENGFYALRESGRFGLDLRMENNDPSVLLEQLGIEAIPIGAPSPLEAELSLSAAETGPVVTSATLRAPGSEVSADGVLEVTSDGIVGADMSLILQSDDLQPWFQTTAIALGQSLDGVPADLTGSVSWFKGDWTAENVEGMIAGVEIAGDARKAAEGPIDGALQLSSLSLPWLAELVYGVSPIPATPDETWSEEEFRTSSLLPVDFSLDVDAARLMLNASEAVEGFSGRLTRTGEQLVLVDAAGIFRGGRLSGEAAMRNVNGVGGFSTELEASDVDLKGIWSGLDAGGGDAGRASGRVNVDATGQSYAGLVSALSGAGQVSVAGASLPGIAQNMLRPILAAADQEGFESDVETVAEIVGSLATVEPFAVPQASSDFAINGGIARFAPVAIRGPGETLTVDGSLDLAASTLSLDLQLALDAGLEAVEGVDPVVSYTLSGPLARPELSANAQPLAGFLSVRALEKEEARVQALQESLQETLRLRREARLYRWRAGEAERIAAAERAAAAERLRLEREREAAEERRRTEAEQAAAERERALRDAAEQAARKAADERARMAAQEPSAPVGRTSAEPASGQAPATPPSADFENPIIDEGDILESDGGASGVPDFPSLPGVSDPLRF